MKGSYNYIAPYYDFLSKLIFGDAIINAHRCLVDFIGADSTILIVGGGTGLILEHIAAKQDVGLDITYVDISAKMIELSSKRDCGNNKVAFVTGDIQDTLLAGDFDVVITPFLLDNFTNDTVKRVFKKIDAQLKAGGVWLFADFQVAHTQQLWQKPLLKVMYFFFQTVCNIEADRLPDTNSLFTQYGYHVVSSKSFFQNFICALVFSKPG